MKIGRAIRKVLTIVVIIAMIVILALMEVGFVVSLMVIFYTLVYTIVAIFMLYSAYENIKAKEIASAIGNILLVVILIVLGIKMIKFLISVLMWCLPQ